MILRHKGHEHDVHVVDDGTLDTVVSIDGIEFRYDIADRHDNGRVKLSWLRVVTEQECDHGELPEGR